MLRPLPSLDADTVLTACLERLIREHTHIALVRNAAGKVVGLITLEDILEELVGEIQDEYDRLPVHAVPSGWGWVVGGGITLEKLKELTEIDLAADPPAHLPEGGLRNLSDWIIGHLPDSLHGGDIIERGGLSRRSAKDSPPKSARSPSRPDRRKIATGLSLAKHYGVATHPLWRPVTTVTLGLRPGGASLNLPNPLVTIPPI